MEKNNKFAVASLVLGLVSIVTWLLPIAGFPTTIIAIVLGGKAIKSDKKVLAIIGFVLGIIFLVVTCINSALGAYMGATGQL